jgi:membrane associated rhomboid family serine protease
MFKRFTPIMTLVALCWLVFVVNNLLWHGHLNQYGIIPRHIGSLPGILWAPFLHASFEHLAANTLPLLILGAIICARNGSEFAMITVAGTLLAGGLTWLFARNASHIGASGLIFCLFGYLASLAYFQRTFGTLILSVVCLLAYGGILKGILPTSSAISWESHVAGLAAGIVLAWIASKLNPPHKTLEIKPVGLGINIEK